MIRELQVVSAAFSDLPSASIVAAASVGTPPFEAVRRCPVKALRKFLWLKKRRRVGGVANEDALIASPVL